jgi:hypothetical protein
MLAILLHFVLQPNAFGSIMLRPKARLESRGFGLRTGSLGQDKTG